MEFSKFSFNVKPMEQEVLIKYQGNDVLTNSSFIQLTGKAKSGKSSVLMSIIGGCFNTTIDTLGLEIAACPPDRYVVYVNTEMSAYETWECFTQLFDRIGGEPANLVVIDCVTVRGKTLRDQVDSAINAYTPYLLIIDGIVDACEDFNNQIYSQKAVDWIHQICNTKTCGAIVTLHQNPEALAKDSKSRGHLGTFIEQKAKSTLSTTKQKDYFMLRGSKMRRGSEFNVKFIWTSNGLTTLETVKNEDPALILIRENEDKSRSEIVKLLCESLSVSEPAISKKLKRLVELNLIIDNKLLGLRVKNK